MLRQLTFLHLWVKLIFQWKEFLNFLKNWGWNRSKSQWASVQLGCLMKSYNLKQFLCFNVLFYLARGKISILSGWWRKKLRNKTSCSQERVGVGTDGLLTLIVRPFIEDTQPKNGHVRQNKRLQIHLWNGILLRWMLDSLKLLQKKINPDHFA